MPATSPQVEMKMTAAETHIEMDKRKEKSSVENRRQHKVSQIQKLDIEQSDPADIKQITQWYCWELAEMFACAVGIYTLFLFYGWYQERIFKTARGVEMSGEGNEHKGEYFEYPMLLTFIQCFGNAACAAVVLRVTQQPKNNVPWTEYLKISSSYVGAMLASTTALQYVSYPTQVLAKSCKLIPVMLMRIVLINKTYNRSEYMAVLFITAGIVVFMCNKTSDTEEGSTSVQGLLLLLISLVLDGFTGPKQESLLQHHTITIHQMMFWLNTYSMQLLLIGLVGTGQLTEGLTYCMTYPSILQDLGALCVCFSIGQLIILHTLFRFNSLFLVTVTTTRKFFSILLSVIWYGHILVFYQWLGVFLVFAGLILDVFNKFNMKRPAADFTWVMIRWLMLLVVELKALAVVYLLYKYIDQSTELELAH